MLSAQPTTERLERLAELETHLTFRISRLSKLLDNQAANYLAGTGFNLTSYRILLVLQTFRETTAADLSRLMVIDRAQISRATSELLNSGHIDARPDPTSQRKKLLSLTDTGNRTIETISETFKLRQKSLEAQLSAENLMGLTEAIDRLSAHLAEELHRPEAKPTRS